MAADNYTTVNTVAVDLNGPNGIALDASGNIYLTNSITSDESVQKIPLATPPSLSFSTTTPAGELDTADPAQGVLVANIGNEPLTFASFAGGTNSAVGSASTCDTSTALAAGASCLVDVEFSPASTASAGTVTGGLLLTDNALNVTGATQTIKVSGTVSLMPAIDSVSPAAGPLSGGNTVTITGNNFTGATMVNFGNLPAGIPTNSDTTITAVAPAGVSTVDVRVTTSYGTSAIVAADTYTYVAVPKVTSISPSTGLTTGGTTVTITGSGFTYASAVNFGSTAASNFTVVSDTSITATAPVGSMGAVDVTVTSPGGTSSTSNADQLTYSLPYYVVTTSNDDSTATASNCTPLTAPGSSKDAACSLRDAITAANAASGGNIVFDSAVFASPQTIKLTSRLPNILGNVTILGATSGGGANLVTLDGGGTVQILVILKGTADIHNLNFANGNGSSSHNGDGGAIDKYNGTLTVSNYAFLSNSAGLGGAIDNNGTATVTDSTFTSNSAIVGGAIQNVGNLLTLINNTFSTNFVSSVGGAIFHQGGKLILDNNIFTGNTNTGVYISGPHVTESHNIFNDGIYGFTMSATDSTADPKLAPLGWYGGPTETMIPTQGSAALCAGSASAATSAGITTDQRGYDLDSACAAGSVDAGAVQLHRYVITTLDDQNDTSPDCTSGTGTSCSLRDAITLANTNAGDVLFAPNLAGTITLGQGSAGDISLPPISGQFNLIGPGASKITISGYKDANIGSIFNLASNSGAAFYGVTIADGNAIFGDAIQGQRYDTITVANSTLTGNTTQGAVTLGGAILASESTLVVANSTFSANSVIGAKGIGGAICVSDSTEPVTITNSTFYSNTTTEFGGAINVEANNLVLIDNSTFAGNRATGSNSEGGAIASVNTLNLNVTNSIFSGNSAASDSAISNVGNLTESHNAFDQTTDTVSFTPSATDITTGTANLSPLGWYGGPTQTMIPLSGSSALNAGQYLPWEPTTDQRGAARPNRTYAAIDMGAVQLTGNPPMIVSISPGTGSTNGGTTVTITGAGFSAASTVSFGSAASTSVTYSAGSGTVAPYLTAVAPAGSVGPVDVIVTNTSGTSAITAADTFTYVAPPAVTSISPSAGPVAGGNVVSINGTGFSGATVVHFGSKVATTFTVVSATQITATAPAATSRRRSKAAT